MREKDEEITGVGGGGRESALGGCVNYLGGVYLPGDLQAGNARLIYTPVRPVAAR